MKNMFKHLSYHLKLLMVGLSSFILGVVLTLAFLTYIKETTRNECKKTFSVDECKQVWVPLVSNWH